MVRTSGIRDKLRSNVLKELARERSTKRPRLEDKNKDDDEESDSEELEQIERERRMARAKTTNNSLLSILPKPKNSSAFGPTIKLDKLLKLPERAEVDRAERVSANPAEKLRDDGMIEVDVSKVVSDVSQTLVKELTVEKIKSTPVVVPKGREKQKNQITYLAQLGKATELERKEHAAQSRINKAAARSKYGW